MRMVERKVRKETTVLVETVEHEEGKDEKEYTVSFKINAQDHELLERYAKEHGVSKSMIIRTAVNKHVSKVEGVIEVKLPLADYSSLLMLIEKGQILSLEAAVAEAIRAFIVKKGSELNQIQNLKASLT